MTWLGYKIYIFTDDEKLFTIRDTEPEKLLMLLIPGCLGMHASLKSCFQISNKDYRVFINPSPLPAA